MYAVGAKDVIEKILPVIDNFETRFEEYSGRSERSDPVAERHGDDLQAADHRTLQIWV